jgi:hypothetical protein
MRLLFFMDIGHLGHSWKNPIKDVSYCAFHLIYCAFQLMVIFFWRWFPNFTHIK